MKMGNGKRRIAATLSAGAALLLCIGAAQASSASVAMVRMGDALGLYKIVHNQGGMTCETLAEKAGVHERYLREWLYARSRETTHDCSRRRGG